MICTLPSSKDENEHLTKRGALRSDLGVDVIFLKPQVP